MKKINSMQHRLEEVYDITTAAQNTVLLLADRLLAGNDDPAAWAGTAKAIMYLLRDIQDLTDQMMAELESHMHTAA